jgi:hypothetical protein
MVYPGYIMGKKRNTMSNGGPCVPGTPRLFVAGNGNFFPCERVSESMMTYTVAAAYIER